MIKRTLIFENPAMLSTRDEQLVVQLSSDETLTETVKTRTIPIEDIGVVVLDNKRVVLTHALLNKLVENNAAVITCDDRHMPTSLFMTLSANTTQHERFMDQLSSSQPLRKQLWQQTIQCKIRNQAFLLETQEYDIRNMKQWESNVKSGDSENHEARASAYYWSRLFSKYIDFFKRGREEKEPNNLLNYGYAVLRAITARSLISSGLLPTLGIHHRNRYNAFCLADDIMEPYRPFVDRVVLTILGEGHDISRLTTNLKKQMLVIPVLDVVIDGGSSPLMVAMQRTTGSLSSCFSGESRKIIYPAFE